MRFAICNELFQDWPWQQAFEATKAHGYTGWEIAPFTLGDQPLALSKEKRSELAQSIESAEIDVIGLHWLLAKTEGYHLTTNDEAVRNKTAEYLSGLAELCRDLGGSIMVLGSPHQRNFPDSMTHAEADINAMKVLEQVIPSLESNGVTLALEPLGPGEGNYWNEARQAVEVIEKLACPNIRLHLDVKAMSTEPQSIADVIRSNAPHLAHFHANDPNLLGPGMGDVPFEPIFEALQEIDYAGWVSVEVFDYQPGVETILRESMQNMQAAL